MDDDSEKNWFDKVFGARKRSIRDPRWFEKSVHEMTIEEAIRSEIITRVYAQVITGSIFIIMGGVAGILSRKIMHKVPEVKTINQQEQS